MFVFPCYNKFRSGAWREDKKDVVMVAVVRRMVVILTCQSREVTSTTVHYYCKYLQVLYILFVQTFYAHKFHISRKEVGQPPIVHGTVDLINTRINERLLISQLCNRPELTGSSCIQFHLAETATSSNSFNPLVVVPNHTFYLMINAIEARTK